MNIYKHSHFSANQFGHGGEKRTAQINEILNDAGIVYNEAQFSLFSPPTKTYLSYFRGLNYTKNFKTNPKKNYAIGRYLRQFNSFVKKTKPSFFIWESTVEYNLLLAEILKKFNIPFISVPHNIESLVKDSRSTFSNKKSPDWLPEEIRYLSYSNKTFTISTEEQWLLSLHGINAGYLPYYPTKQLVTQLLSIRQKREAINRVSTRKKQILILGTFHNRATYNGYFDLINNIKNYKNIQINVVGYGSESLKDIFTESQIRVWGEVNNELLADIMIQCDYAIIQQEPTSGALTRIPELLIAGIPVIANSAASRNCSDYKGVTVYFSRNELLDLINSDNLITPPFFDRPIEEARFADYIKKNC